ncbi:MAG: SpoIVB peptidase S55 domain-containing protein [Halanaerobiaceae bacterium]
MLKIKPISIIFCFLIFLIVSMPAIAEDFMPLEEIEPGMKGVAKTVFSGTEVEEFSVEIIDIIPDNMNNNSILIKSESDKIDEIGGIAAGMSGSPVYVEDKLIGAIASSWEETKMNHALVTPIMRMQELQENKTTGSSSNSGLNSENENKNPGDTDDSRLNTPLILNGVKGRARDRIKDEITSADPEVLPGSNLTESEDSSSLEPGSAIAVQLVRGDIDVASLGTLTHIDRNQILAMGHPFTNQGSVNFLFSKAYINSIIPSETQPFKLGTPFKELLGKIKQDRSAGIAGTLKEFPYIIPLEVRVKDETRDRESSTAVQIINDDSFLASLGNNIALEAVDNTIDRIGSGTAESRIKVMGKEIPGLTIERKNLYYSQDDIAMTALSDFNQLLNILGSNSFKNPDILDIVLELEISDEDNTALIQEAKILNDTVSPGDNLEIEVTLRPYREETFTRKVEVELPEDMNEGMASLAITGGFLSSGNDIPDEIPANHENEDGEVKQNQITGYKDFDSIIEDYLDTPQNNDLIIQVYPGSATGQEVREAETEEEEIPVEDSESKEEEQPETPENQIVPGQDLGIPGEEGEEIKQSARTDYVLEGEINLQVEVESDN